MSEKCCPICQRPAVERYRPFCSARCADVDLHRWLAGVYVVETADTPETDRIADNDDEFA